MKKVMFCLCAFMCSVFVKAQGLGDYMEIDGVPGFVFYLDETGEHGLVMSFPAISEKKAKKWIKKGLLTEDNAKLLCPSYNNSGKNIKIEVTSKEMKSYRKDLVPLLGNDGEQNRDIILDYCNKKNIPLELFIGQAFAKHLGTGWYIPGVNEIKLFAEFYAGGVGKDHYLGNNTYYNTRPKEVSNDPVIQKLLKEFASLTSGLCSSTMKDIDYGFQALKHCNDAGKMGSFKIKHWFEIREKIRYNNSYCSVESLKLDICAVHKF